MKEIATIEFTDEETREPVVAVVRASARAVGVCLSSRNAGDVEVFLNSSVCRKLVAALREALSLKKNSGPRPA